MSEKNISLNNLANDRNTGKITWKYTEYFPGNDELSIRCNWELNQFGYSFLFYQQGVNIIIPEMLIATPISPDTKNEKTVFEKLVYDPKRAKIETIVPLDPEESKNTRKFMENIGWTFVDSNITNDIYVQTLNEVQK